MNSYISGKPLIVEGVKVLVQDNPFFMGSWLPHEETACKECAAQHCMPLTDDGLAQSDGDPQSAVIGN